MDENYNNPTENNETNENNSVHFEADANIPVVVKAKENNKSKLPVIIIACVLALAVIVGCVIYFAKSGGNNDKENIGGNIVEGDSSHNHDSDFMDYINEIMSEEMTDESGSVISREEYVSKIQQQVQEATTTLSSDVGVTSPHVIENNAAEDNVVKEGTQAEDTHQLELAEAQIKAFFDRSCYLQGALYADNEGDPISIAFDDDNVEIFTNLDGTEISILKLGGKTYIKRPATKQYIEFTDALMNMMGISAEDFSFEFNAAKYEDMKAKLVSTYDITVDGKNGVCHEFKNDSRYFRFYSVDGELKQLDICNEDGSIDSQLSISYFSEAIPSDQLTLKGYTESTIGAIFADLMTE